MSQHVRFRLPQVTRPRSTGCRRSAAVLLTTLLFVLVADSSALPLGADRAEPRGMFELYENNRQQGIPNYITEDFLVLSYLMLLERTVEQMEATRLAPAFHRLIEQLTAGLAQLPESEIRDANSQFLGVLKILLSQDLLSQDSSDRNLPATDSDLGDPASELNGTLDGSVRDEVERVLAARGEAFSPVVAQRLDYSQFRVRGRYARSAELRRYFRAARYAGTVLFALVPSQATSITAEVADRLTAQALQLSQLIAEQAAVREAWDDLDQQTDWWFGPADDLTIEDLVAVAADNLSGDLPELRQRLFEHARAYGRQPRIVGSVVHIDQLEPNLTALDVLTGWRLFPQRYSPDSAALGHLVYNQVGPYLGSAQPRSLGFAGGQLVKGLPSALELMALLGSEDAGIRLDATDERNFEGYEEAAEEARSLLLEAEGLSGEHLALLRFWLTLDDAGKAAEHRSSVSGRHTNTALAFWTYWRYVGLLYSKQSYSGVSKGFAMPPERTDAWLEPAAELYARLARNAEELAARSECEPCATYAHILERCIDIAVAERAGLDLDAEDIDFLNDLDHQLFRLIGRHDAPIVVDVHSDPASRQVVQAGIGWPRVVAKNLGQDQQPRGALFRHYELHQPIDERLNDDAWSRMLLAGKMPGSED